MSSTPAPVPLPAPSASLRRNRLAVLINFFAVGFGLAAWVVHVPNVMGATGLDDAGLGFLLLVMGVASLAAMQGGGYLSARYGSRGLLIVGALVMVVGLLGAGLAQTPHWLGVALGAFGVGSGAMDIGMNEQAVRVERAYGRPIMGSMHAFFSVGGATGAAVGVPLLSLGLPSAATMGIMGGVSLLLAAVALPWVLAGPAVEEPAAMHAAPAPADHAAPEKPGGPSVLRLGTILAIMAFSFFLAEGTVNDWSARHSVEHLGQSASTAAIAYGVFSVFMTLGRFAADRVAGAVGAVAVVRYGSLLAAAGMALVVLAPSFPVAVAGWGLYGVGLSGIVPQLFSAAGALVSGPRAPVVLSRVVGAGYVGLLAGPAIVGWLSAGIGLNQALLLPVLLCLMGTALSVSLRGAGPRA
ncbi:MFS transporter [Galactobacter caseinivorans]|uniref:MFS transporter n=1 Tax=Galactobacter caseinivorans TaxID=2676123 RepID=A0A496PM47_9MICC|nr:MFS transporter [Galactobacter caseinivorans]RKW71602.1 MFS transporter [Galactobacter caseinivorans]